MLASGGEREYKLSVAQLCGSKPASLKMACASADARYSSSALARPRSLAGRQHEIGAEADVGSKNQAEGERPKLRRAPLEF